MPLATDKAWLKSRSKHMTGFCNDFGKPGQHEGQKPTGNKGMPLPTCEFTETCPCICHYNVDKMFEMTGLPRQLIPNPEYIPAVSEFVLPEVTYDPLGDVAATRSGVNGSPVAQHATGALPVPTAAPLAIRRTETGRAARGGLEAQVWDACTMFLKDFPGVTITPPALGVWIVGKYKIPTPSSGAINAVWDRWSKLGFAEQAKKPNRFVKFTQTGTWEELQRIKASTKRQAKSAASLTKRGYR